MTVAEKPAEVRESCWRQANWAYLKVQLQYLRLLLHRRVLWLRHHWRHDPLKAYQGQVVSEEQADRLLAGEEREAEARFYWENSEAAAIGRALSQIEHVLTRKVEDVSALGNPPALELSAQLFGLTSFERNVLMLCLAPELDSAFEALYGYVQDDLTRKYPTMHLTLSLFAGAATTEEEVQAARGSFLPQAPLRRFRLITLDPSSSGVAPPGSRALRLDERMGDYLQGVNHLDERLAELLRPIPSAPLAPVQHEWVNRLADTIRSFPTRLINLLGSPQTGKSMVAKALGARLGLSVYELDAERLPPPGPERLELKRLLAREAILWPMAYYLRVPSDSSANRSAPLSLADLVENLEALVIVGSWERWPTSHESLVCQVPKLDASGQLSLWQQALAETRHLVDGHLARIVQQFDFGPEAVAQSVMAARSRLRLHASPGGTLTPDQLWEACREYASSPLNELAQRIRSSRTWDEIVLPPELLQHLREIAAQVAQRYQVYESWGFGIRLSRGQGISALFSGSASGTGKTLAAEILANHLHLDLYRIDLAGVVSKYVGETEKNLRRVFDTAEQSGAILFFDEADALFGKRTEVKDSHDRYANIEVNYLLQRMEEYRGLAILATNRKSALDRAFLRRLRFQVDFPFPDPESRRVIWQKVFAPGVPLDRLDYDLLERLEIAGGNISNIAVNAAFLAATQGTRVGMSHIMQAARREYAKIDKLMTEAEFGPYYEQVAS